MRGKFIVLEGGEGAGKSTVAEFLRAQLHGSQFLFTPTPIRDGLVWGFTREPGGTPLAEKIRALMISTESTHASAETQFGLIWVARFAHVKETIRPALEKGINVISERFDSSTYAYQIFGQEAPQLKPLFFECRKLLGDCVPDLYIWLDVLPSEGLRRIRRNRNKKEPIDQFEQRELAFHKRVRDGLKEFFKTVPSVTINANGLLHDVQADVLDEIRNRLSPS